MRKLTRVCTFAIQPITVAAQKRRDLVTQKHCVATDFCWSETFLQRGVGCSIMCNILNRFKNKISVCGGLNDLISISFSKCVTVQIAE